MITDQKPLVVMISKYVAMLLHCQECIMLHIHQYRVHILYKSGPDLHIADWLSHIHSTENGDQ